MSHTAVPNKRRLVQTKSKNKSKNKSAKIENKRIKIRASTKEGIGAKIWTRTRDKTGTKNMH